jgi:hypothetical protein
VSNAVSSDQKMTDSKIENFEIRKHESYIIKETDRGVRPKSADFPFMRLTNRTQHEPGSQATSINCLTVTVVTLITTVSQMELEL